MPGFFAFVGNVRAVGALLVKERCPEGEDAVDPFLSVPLSRCELAAAWLRCVAARALLSRGLKALGPSSGRVLGLYRD